MPDIEPSDALGSMASNEPGPVEHETDCEPLRAALGLCPP